MLSDGLKYQDSRMATCEEMKQDLAPFALHDAAAKSKGGPVLLRETDMSVAEIAGQVGYESQSKFTAAFKEQFGQLPTAYRRT